MSKKELIHNQKESRYEYHIGEHIAYISYEQNGDTVRLTHTIVPDELSGRGLAKKLLEDVLEKLRDENKKAIAVCSYIVKYREKHPDKRDYFID